MCDVTMKIVYIYEGVIPNPITYRILFVIFNLPMIPLIPYTLYDSLHHLITPIASKQSCVRYAGSYHIY